MRILRAPATGSTGALCIAAVAELFTTGCRSAPEPRAAVQSAAISRISRTAIVSESTVIAGRAKRENLVLLLTDAPALLRVDPHDGSATRRELTGLRNGESPWNLALTADGSLWTLLSFRALARLTDEAQVVERFERTIALGLYGHHGLVLQFFGTEPGANALVHGPPGGATWQGFGSLKVRALGTHRAGRAVANLVYCGMTDTAELPCWFVDATAVDFVRPEGGGRLVELGGAVQAVAPRPALVEGLPHPIRDLYIDASGAFWTLWTDGDRVEDANLGWVIARYSRSGELLDVAALPEPVRLILRCQRNECRLLARSGHVIRLEFR